MEGDTMRLGLIVALSAVLAISSHGMNLDLRKFQYPVEDAKSMAKSVTPRFCAFLLNSDSRPRVPGLTREQGLVVKQKYRHRLMNEHQLYGKGDTPNDEKILLERYCTRYNRTLASELGL